MEEAGANHTEKKTKRQNMVGRVALRTLFFDARITAALDGESSSSPKAKQVVLLGAGMDTRAWRLKMPAGTTLW